MIYAKISKETLIVVSVEVANPEWVAAWIDDNPSDANTYVAADVEGERAAAIGWLYDETAERFICPMPDVPGDWVFDRELWRWVDPSAPEPDEPITPDTPVE